uniref:Transposon TX1 uncharacterized n=1 Tax=Cajanus cajan TaxID=3821 RepID=A0A151RUM0_CAJCA|nr:Transposon TX1 uncharacterized [Cajanus cajan]
MDSELVDIPLEGYNFTWIKSRGSPTQVEERLDRAMATQSWLDQFPHSRLINAVAARSDHSPILLKLSMQITLRTRRSFRFENAWLDEPDLTPLVEASWHRGHFPDILDRLKFCSKDMDEWGRQLRLRFRAPIDACRRQLLELREQHDANSVSAFSKAQERLSTLLAKEEAFWKQRAKVYWLKDGDKNTKFFHAMASERKKKNLIQRLTKPDGTIAIAQQDLCQVAQNYFNDLFEAQQSDIAQVIDHISPKITAADNDSLLQPFCISEFKTALFSMHSDKSPGPDGLNPGFYKRFWDLLGPEVFAAGTHWLEQGEFPPQLNNTNVVLIPKTANPTSMKDLRPISLCNVIYKILFKVLANRMKPLLNQCISPEQSAFVENRSILDNVLVAIELIHHMKCKKNGRTGEVALKIDINKAFDRVD